VKLFPAIDLLGGNAVRLEEGKRDRATVFHANPVELVHELTASGADRLHVVDLDGAFAGKPVQTELIGKIVRECKIPVEVGGGIRDRAAIDTVVALGAAFVVALIVAVALPFLMGRWSTLTAVGILIAVWLALSSIVGLWDRIKGAQSSGDLWSRIRSLPRAFYGMHLAHFGIAVFIFAVAMVKTYEESKDVKMKVGTTVSVGGYRFEFAQTSEIRGPNYRAVRATINVARDGEQVGTMFPEKRTYDVQRMPMTEAAIDAGVLRHLYVSLGEPLSANEWIVRIYHKPFIDWIWGGCLIMAFGALLSVAGARRHRAAQPDGTVAAAGPA